MVVGSPLKVGSDSDRQPAPQPVRVFASPDNDLWSLVLVQHLCTRLCTWVCIVKCIDNFGTVPRYLGSAHSRMMEIVNKSPLKKHC